jgi:hypothetical protein
LKSFPKLQHAEVTKSLQNIFSKGGREIRYYHERGSLDVKVWEMLLQGETSSTRL